MRGLGIGMVAAMAALAMTAAPAAATEYVLVNAQADGDTPVAGAMARVHRCDGSAPLRQRNGASGERTFRTGAVVLVFARLPRCFVVSVTGGRAGGRALNGSFLAEGRDGPDELENVPVTPVSTLVHRVLRAHPRMREPAAERRVARRLRIPSSYDAFDLQSDDSVFDGDRFLAVARREGGVARLTRKLLADPTPRSFRRLGPARAAQANPLGEWWNELDVTGAALKALKDFGTSFVWDNVVKAGGQWVIGRFLDYYGLSGVKDFLFPPSDMAKLIAMVNQLNNRINALEAGQNKILQAIAELKSRVTASPAVVLLTHIDKNQNELKVIAGLKPTDNRRGATTALLKSIARDEDDRTLLNSVVAGIGGGAGLLVDESKRAALTEFFTPADSQRVREVYDYYALYQLRLANLLTELWNTQSCSQPAGRAVPEDCLDPKVIQARIDEVRGHIERQQTLLKPPVPAQHFVDVKRHLMWVANPPWVSGAAYRPLEEGCLPLNACGRVNPNWRDPGIDLAGEDELTGLIRSVPEGQNPYEFLVKNAGLVRSAPMVTKAGDLGLTWLGLGGKEPWYLGAADDFKPVNRIWCVPLIRCHQRIERVNLMTVSRDLDVFYNRLGDQDPQYYFAYALPRPQPVAPGTYWYE